MSNFNAAGGSQSNKFSLFIFSTKVYFTFIQSCLRVIRIAPPGLDYFNGNVILNAESNIRFVQKHNLGTHWETTKPPEKSGQTIVPPRLLQRYVYPSQWQNVNPDANGAILDSCKSTTWGHTCRNQKILKKRGHNLVYL